MKVFFVLFMVAYLAIADVQLANVQPQPRGIDFSITVCTAPGKCEEEQAGVVTSYVYTGCSDPTACTWIPPLSDYQYWGVSFPSKNEVAINWNADGSAVLFLTAGPTSDKYRMFYLLNKEFTFDVNLSTVSCGLNAALFMVAAPEDGGKERWGYAGAQYGTGTCDGQPTSSPESCGELDLMEANALSQSFNIHTPCGPQGGFCKPTEDKGCGGNPYSAGFTNFHGRGPTNQIDSTKTFTVVTRFITVDGTDNGQLKEIQRFYIQDGKTIDYPVGPLSDEYCKNPYVSEFTQPLKDGLVLVFNGWGNPKDDPNSMFWLDQPPNGPCPIYTDPDPRVVFGNVRVGPIGSTVTA